MFGKIDIYAVKLHENKYKNYKYILSYHNYLPNISAICPDTVAPIASLCW